MRARAEQDDSYKGMLMLCVWCVALAMSVTRATISEEGGGVKGVRRPAVLTYDNYSHLGCIAYVTSLLLRGAAFALIRRSTALPPLGLKNTGYLFIF